MVGMPIHINMSKAIRSIEYATSGEGGFRKSQKSKTLHTPPEKDMHLFMKMIDSSEPKWAEKAHSSLLIVTGADFKYDSAAWRNWYDANKTLDRKTWMLASMKNAGLAVDETDLTKSIPVFLDAMASENPGVRAAGYFLIRLATDKHLEFNPLGSEKNRDRHIAAWRAAVIKK